MRNSNRPQWTYFTANGDYGDARGLIIIDTTNFLEGDWQAIDEATDSHRQTAAEIAGMSLNSYFIPVDPTLKDIEDAEGICYCDECKEENQ